jgi:allantoate deiminase
MTPRDHAREMVRRCRQLAGCTEVPGETTRTFLSRPMKDVHRKLAGWMSAAGMVVRVDAAGNIRGVYPAASTAPAPRLFIGSHLDTVPNAGAFDGVLGVVMGGGLIELLGGRRFPFSIEVVGFSDEEGVRFGEPFIGSRAFAGTFDPVMLALQDVRGRRLDDAIRDYGLDPDRLPAAQAEPSAAGYLEFHIEQGPILDELNLPLGIVEAIVGQTRVDVAFTGMANHAGTTPMLSRHDALAGAAEWIVSVEHAARTTTGLVATVGRVHVHPGTGNVIPGRCELSLDVRHADDGSRVRAASDIEAAARDIARRRALDVSWAVRLDQPSVVMDGSLTEALARSVERAGFPPHRLFSGAGHDAMVVARRMPVSMLFMRSEKGISHHPDESVRDDDVAAALEAGSCFLEELARVGHAG